MNKRIKGQKFTKATYKRGGYHWMSIKDRLPKLYESVLVLIYYEGGYSYFESMFIGLNTDGVWEFGLTGKVVAWMYLPSDPEIKSLTNK